MTSSTRGRLLVATPPLVDPNFDRTVVLVLEHTDDGAFGLVINRPSEASIADAFDEWTEHIIQPAQVFVGGPVQTDALIALGVGPAEPADGWSPILDGMGTVDLARPPEELPPIGPLRVFAGYSGWSSGQLEHELAQGAWIVVEAQHADAFAAQPEELWRTVLGRQHGELSWLANFPDDLETN